MTSNENSVSDVVLDRAVDAFRRNRTECPPPVDVSATVLRQLNQANLSSPPHGRDSATFSRRWGRVIASLAALMFLGFGLWLGVNGKVSIASEVAEAVIQVKSVAYEIVQVINGAPGKPTLIMVSGPERMRAEFPNGEVLIVNLSKGRQVRLIPKEKRAVIRSAFSSDTSSLVESRRLSPLESLRRMSRFATTDLPPRSIDDRETIGFVCDEGPYVGLKVWVDPETKLPVLMESTSPDDAGKVVQNVSQHFVYNSPIDDSLFEVSVPSGYQVDVEPATLANSKPRTFQIVPGEGVGPLRFGMTESKVIEILGKPSDKRMAPKGHLLDYGSEGLYLEVNGEEGLSVIHCISQLAYGFDIRTFSGKTNEGIGIGASPQEIKVAYGEPIQEFPNRGISLMMYVSPPATFKLREGKVSEVILAKPRMQE